ncbi:uncharacterized protein LOC115631277 [Scaptodrosophila lebanonensis]|uniref:Uncharacterized protein LOC115631277 n=1 Tax=Drosophila lebanonensis TaxID=7225 RepID=A0A6J2U5L1_DROLE|nr:uncharacterized protein LOC115631277 [Scaptodrosophila lebanonensis]
MKCDVAVLLLPALAIGLATGCGQPATKPAPLAIYNYEAAAAAAAAAAATAPEDDGNLNDTSDYYSDNDDDDNDNDDAKVSIDVYLSNSQADRHHWRGTTDVVARPDAAPKRVPRHPQHYLPRHNRLEADFDKDYPADEPGKLTELKVQQLGTSEAARSEFDRHREQELELKRLAKEHRQRMETETRCRLPQRRVIYIANETSMDYSPRGTVLYRCDESTGCCSDNYKTCTAKTVDYVKLAFWERSHILNTIRPVMLSLANHTECHCVNLNAMRQKRSNKGVAPVEYARMSSQCQCPKHFTSFNWDSSRSPSTTFSSHCRCDCHLSDLTCQRMKNGEEGFAMSARICILTKECSAPICNYGIYNVHSGRCPRSEQQQKQQQQHLVQRAHHGFG